VHDDEVANEFDAMFAQMARRSRNDRFVPNTDVYLSEDGKTVLVQVELAGADPKSLRVAVEDRSLYIEGRRAGDAPASRGDCLLKEIEYGSFQRKLHLPVPIDHREAGARYHDGILSIALPIVARPEFPLVRTEIRLILKRVS
jgi:HSP20 family molecular chaperone IbpA